MLIFPVTHSATSLTSRNIKKERIAQSRETLRSWLFYTPNLRIYKLILQHYDWHLGHREWFPVRDKPQIVPHV